MVTFTRMCLLFSTKVNIKLLKLGINLLNSIKTANIIHYAKRMNIA